MLNMNIASCQKCCHSKEMLLKYIDEISFAMYDLLLYLDTHPGDLETRMCYQQYSKHRQEAVEEYALRYGPLTMHCPMNTNNNCWDWTMQPWPWELSRKGRC